MALAQLTDDPVVHIELTKKIDIAWKSSIQRGIAKKKKKAERLNAGLGRTKSLLMTQRQASGWSSEGLECIIDVRQGSSDAVPSQTLPGASKLSPQRITGEIMLSCFCWWEGTNSL